MASNRSYRELRPAFDATSPHQTSTASSPDNRCLSSQPGQKPSRRNVWVACESCRQRKTKKCSADRPKCTNCMSRGFDCRYTADPNESRSASLKRRYDELERQNDCLNEFFCAIRSMPESQAYDVVRRIRSGASAEDVLSQVEGGYMLLQLSDRIGDAPHCRDMPAITTSPRGLLTPESSHESTICPPTPPQSRASSSNHMQANGEDVARLKCTSMTRNRSRECVNRT
ncbi:C6 transcription factor [Colletotrichum truncatum]|uniref:C6 transcription factor n=1 Tax=Colletotrichum truncatum TaxID=5467 RepID=A0ACC3YKK3_COLTU|nr:C6 transcription factor [Colletotrichum truncatum]KAF6783396.1 C6 transcription factor [Colletotrichum truncatum]